MNDNPSSWRTLMPLVSLVGIIFFQSVSGTISNFPAYSTQLIQLLSISNLQLNNLIVSWESGKLLDCFSTAAADHLPEWLMLIISIVLGAIGYGVQFLFLVNKINYLSYWQLLILHVLAGNSICWINTLCCRAITRHFTTDRSVLIALTSTYSGLSGKLYTVLVEGFHGAGARNASTYLLLNCVVPAGAGLLFLALVRHPNPTSQTTSVQVATFSFMFMSASATGLYAMFDSVSPAIEHVSPRLRLMIFTMMIMLPIVVPLVMAVVQFTQVKVLWHKVIMLSQVSSNPNGISKELVVEIGDEEEKREGGMQSTDGVEKKIMVGDEHGVKQLVLSVDFWLYFWVYACGATLSMVYFNNLGHISKSRGLSETPFLLAISSSFNFFAKLFAVMFHWWFTRGKNVLTRPLTIVVLMIPMSTSFFLLLNAYNDYLYISTSILGICSSIITSVAAPITSELFGSKNSGMNHKILLSNIPVTYLLYGSLAAVNYDSECQGSNVICTGSECFRKTFLVWGCICSFGTVLSFILYCRTRKYYRKCTEN